LLLNCIDYHRRPDPRRLAAAAGGDRNAKAPIRSRDPQPHQFL